MPELEGALSSSITGSMIHPGGKGGPEKEGSLPRATQSWLPTPSPDSSQITGCCFPALGPLSYPALPSRSDQGPPAQCLLGSITSPAPSSMVLPHWQVLSSAQNALPTLWPQQTSIHPSRPSSNTIFSKTKIIITPIYRVALPAVLQKTKKLLLKLFVGYPA